MNKKINRYLDHAVLKPEMTIEEVKEAIQIGINYEVRTVCVRPCDIDIAAEMCKGTETEVCCVLGFPHGVSLSETKAYEANMYCKKGVSEIDMVANYSFIKSELWDEVEKDIKDVHDITKVHGALLKVILETNMLSDEQIKKATQLCASIGVEYVKTSTGFNGEGASVKAIDIMLAATSNGTKVKASGGIRDYEKAMLFIEKGCERLGVGCSSTPIICDNIMDSTIRKDSY